MEKKKKKVFFIGIAGSGMLPLARLAVLYDWQVFGSDHNISTDLKNKLNRSGIIVFRSHAAKQVHGHDVIVYSSAIKNSHLEKKEAIILQKEEGVELLHRMDFLNLLAQDCTEQIAISGTHGKTSTASLAGWSLLESGLNPDIIVGGHPLYLENGIRKGAGSVCVFETDESDASFLKTKAKNRLILNIDHDHLDHYGSFENLVKAFYEFALLADLIVINADDPQLQKLLLDSISNHKTIHWYSTNRDIKKILPEAIHKNGIIAEFQKNSDNLNIIQILNQTVFLELKTSLPGRHYASNALGFLVLMHLIWKNLSLEKILSSFISFPGVERRMQLLGKKNGAFVYDDYAHHPTEITAVLQALRLKIKDQARLFVVFQPHRFTRTKALFKQFAQSLVLADEILILPIFSAGEKALDGVTAEMMNEEILRHSNFPKRSIVILQGFFFDKIFSKVKNNDIVAFLGAGDISKRLRQYLANS